MKPLSGKISDAIRAALKRGEDPGVNVTRDQSQPFRHPNPKGVFGLPLGREGRARQEGRHRAE